MEWRLKRIGLGLALAWAQYEPLERNWSWTKDESKAFTAHNRYIVEAMQRRAPDWLRYATEIEYKADGMPAEPAVRSPVRRRTAKREDAAC